MNILEAAKTGLAEIRSHKLRSFLSFSAIAFGVAAILYTFASVHGMYEEQRRAFELAGPGRLKIGRNWEQAESGKRGLSPGLTLSDAAALRAALPGLHMLYPVREARADFRCGALAQNVAVRGVTPEWRKRDWVYRLRGRLLSDDDVARAARVCVLVAPAASPGPSSAYAGLLRRVDLLGRSVRLGGQPFTVVGVLQSPPLDDDPRWFTGQDTGDALLVPVSAAQRYLARGEQGESAKEAIDGIELDTGDAATLPAARRRIEAVLRARHRGERDFRLEDFRDSIRSMLEHARKQAAEALFIGLIAILAGGVGIMNVTLAAVFARVREIGIRRALGATRADILLQFVLEASLLGLLGGVAGLALGVGGIVGLAENADAQLRGLQAWHFLAALGIAAGAGFLFSLYPAYQASNLDPLEALRCE